ncbi:MAG: tetratricopeptide repeat protein, partial [Spirochaetes bacterium]|nr:tetratricopeptide repeat protein [Spirochaetota bacterium]
AQGRFVPSQRLSESVAAFERQSGLRVLALEGYRARLERNPDDLDLREQLVRAYAWNGMLQEALEESGDVLVNKLYAIFAGLDGDLAETYRLLDLASVYEAPVATVAAEASAASGALKKDAEAFRRAKARLEQALKGKDAKRLAKAESDLASAAEALAGRLAEAAELTDRADWAFSGAEDLIGASVTEAASEGADAQMLSRLAPWTWDMSADLDFLSRRASENPLAWYCATKILMFEGKGAPPPPPAGRLAGADTLRLQAGLWSTGELDEDAFSAADWYGRGDELAAALASLAKGEVGAPPSGEALASLADEASAGLTALSARGSRAAADLRSAKASLLARARSRMRARAYQYDGETQQDRRALADMYLRLGKPEEAVKALSRVLAINPSDAASLFTLGRARETSGDWHGAMDAYGTVYDLNPRYESAVSSYNRLAGIHAPSVSAAITTVVDTARSSETARLEYTAPLGGAMELRSSYAVDRKKIHAPASGAFPASMTLHTLEVQVPFSVAGTGASILGIAGGTAQNKLDNFLPPAIGDLSPESVADYVVVAPRLGVGATWKGGGFDVSALYRFNQVEDTFFADRSVFYGHHGATEAGFYGETAARQLARSLGVRAKAGLSWIYSPYAQAGAAPNLLTSLAAEARVGSLLAASPSTTLDLSVSASWEDASATADDYWAPPGILSVKGGPSLAARFGSPEGSEVSVATRLWPGLYSAEGDGRLSLDGELSLGFAKRGLSLSLSVAGGWTQATATAAQYWSGSVGLGLKAAVGDYIIP